MNRLLVLAMVVAMIISLTIPSAQAGGAEIDRIDVRLDGKTIAGFSTTSQNRTEAQLFGLLMDRPLKFDQGFVIPVDPGKQKSTTLEGKIEVRIERQSHPRITVEVETLPLVWKETIERLSGWYVSEECVKRLAKLAHAEASQIDREKNREILLAALTCKTMKTYLHDNIKRIELDGMDIGADSMDLGFGPIPVKPGKRPDLQTRHGHDMQRVIYASPEVLSSKLASLNIALPSEGVWGPVVVYRIDEKWTEIYSHLPEH